MRFPVLGLKAGVLVELCWPDVWTFSRIKMLSYLTWNGFFTISSQENLTDFSSFSDAVDFLDDSLSRYSWTGSSFSYHMVFSSCILNLPFNHDHLSFDFPAVPFTWKLGFLPEHFPKVQPKMHFLSLKQDFIRKSAHNVNTDYIVFIPSWHTRCSTYIILVPNSNDLVESFITQLKLEAETHTENRTSQTLISWNRPAEHWTIPLTRLILIYRITLGLKTKR